MTESYDIGDMRTFTGTFTDVSGTLANPSTVTVEIREPDGNLATPAPSSATTGIWTVDYEFTQSGRHVIRFQGDGAINSAQETEVYIKRKGAL